jgi:beta-lactamase class A
VQNAERAVKKIVSDELARGRIADVAVYFRDLNNGPWFGINEKVGFIPASLLKVPLAMAVLMKVQKTPPLLKQEVVFDGEHADFNQVYLDFPGLEKGKAYSTAELLGRMLGYSDNDAMRILYESLPAGALSQVYDDLGIQEQDSPEDEITVVTYASFFRILYNSTYLSRPVSEYMLSLLAEAQFKEGLRAGVPQSIMIAHKFGEREDESLKIYQLHDCGIVYAPGKPYLICVMTRGSNFKDLSPVIARISEAVYENFTQE